MSSVRSFLAQPVTRTYVITQGDNGQTGVYYFSKEDIDAFVARNSNVSAVGSVLTVTSGDFSSTLNDLDVTGTMDNRKSLIDMGKQIVIGNTINSRLITLRQIQFFAPSSQGGDGFEAYIVVENETTDVAPSGWGRFTVRVARI